MSAQGAAHYLRHSRTGASWPIGKRWEQAGSAWQPSTTFLSWATKPPRLIRTAGCMAPWRAPGITQQPPSAGASSCVSCNQALALRCSSRTASASLVNQHIAGGHRLLCWQQGLGKLPWEGHTKIVSHGLANAAGALLVGIVYTVSTQSFLCPNAASWATMIWRW